MKTFMSEGRLTEPEISALEQKLSFTSRKLSDAETALRVLIEHREGELFRLKEELSDKIKTMVLPYLTRLREANHSPDLSECIDIIENNLQHLYDDNYARLSAPERRLSPTELKVAQLVRDGKANKEIARLLKLSKSTILTHRHHIRTKLGIRNQKVNLCLLLRGGNFP
jgi:DNA-binding CsgD family transcriptional regulator